jgi:hypothetical protein
MECKESVNLGQSAFGEASRRLILSLVHIRMEFEWIGPFEYLVQQVFGVAGFAGDQAPIEKIAGGLEECAHQVALVRVIWLF